METPVVRADINFSAEVRCPYCSGLNKFHQLSAVHTNVKNQFNKGTLPKEWNLETKCQMCDKKYKIVRTVFA